MPSDVACRRATIEEILPLRHRILRDGLPLEAARFEGDDASGTRHYAARHGDTIVTCLTLMPSSWDGHPAWQLRGMATDSHEQGRGVGKALLQYAVDDATGDEPGRILWCNARTPAIGFYERLGWQVVSEPFDVPTAGPHVKMVLGVRATAPRRASAVAFIALELAFLAVAHAFGGPPWVALGVLACVVQVVADFRLSALMGIMPALGWLGVSHATGNRELFFPYAMYLAAYAAGQFSGRRRLPAAGAGSVILAAFMAIRGLQGAMPRVLAVEFAVAGSILVVVVAVQRRIARNPCSEVVLAIFASLAAYAGLAL